MFGAVTNGTIADQLKTQFDIALDKKKIHVEKVIKTLGEHEVELRLHPEVVATLKVRVESTTPINPAAIAAEVAAAAEASRTESRGHKRAQQETTEESASEKAPKAEKKAKSPKSAPAK